MDLHAVSCFLILLTCTGVSFGQELILPERINGTVGGDVLFTPLKIPDPRPTICIWRFNGALIISAQPSGTTIADSYQGRGFFSTVTLALELRSLTERDTGQYTLTVQTDKGNFTAQTSLQVLGMSFGQEVILPQRISGTVGGDVLFTPLKIPDLPHTITSWRFNGALIITAQPSGTTIQDSYQGRVSFNTFTLALALRSLTESDIGQYTLTVQNNKGTFTAQTSLQVLGRHTDGGGDSLSGEAIARIVIVVLLGVAGIAGLIFYFVKNKCQK